MRKTTGYALLSAGGRLEPWEFERRDLRADDVAVRVTHCGVCHSDVHAVDGATSEALPLVPGHEFVGVVSAVGSAVTRFGVGDSVAVGNIVDSCGSCEHCRAGEESYCREFPTLTYGGVDRHDGRPQRGAYSAEYVAPEAFVYALPPELDPAGAAPLMCAGVTTWGPLRHWNVGPGDVVGVVGLGGLGHLAVKFAKALGARVAVFTTSPGKAADARELGADEVVVSSDAAAMAAAAYRFDFVLDTASAKHDPSPYLRTLRMDGTLCMLGIPDRYEPEAMSLLLGRRNLSASGSGGRRTTQEMLEFCAEHGITADVEVLPAAQAQLALDRLARGDVRYRLVLDMSA